MVEWFNKSGMKFFFRFEQNLNNMRKSFLLFVSILSYALTMAQPPNIAAEIGDSFGERIKADGAISTNSLQTFFGSREEGTKKADVKIKGIVSDVCTMEGCWIKIATENGNMMIKMKDHKFAVPISLNGKTVVVEGLAEEKITTVQQLKHFAIDAGKSKTEIEKIKEPKKEIIIEAKGVLVI